MTQSDIADAAAEARQKVQEKAAVAKDKAREAADTAKDKARETADATKEHPTRTGGIIAAVVGGLAAIWALRRKLRRRKADKAS